MYNFVLLIDLKHVCIQDRNYQFLLDLFSSYTSSLEFTILNLSLSTIVKRNKTKYLIYYKSPDKLTQSIQNKLISIYGPGHNMYKKITKDKSFYTIGKNHILLLSSKQVRFMLDYIQSYIDGQV